MSTRVASSHIVKRDKLSAAGSTSAAGDSIRTDSSGWQSEVISWEEESCEAGETGETAAQPDGSSSLRRSTDGSDSTVESAWASNSSEDAETRLSSQAGRPSVDGGPSCSGSGGRGVRRGRSRDTEIHTGWKTNLTVKFQPHSAPSNCSTVLGSRLIQLHHQQPHPALSQPSVQPCGRLLGRPRSRQLAGVEVLPAAQRMGAGLIGESTDQPTQSGIPSALVEARRNLRAW
ncbi:hypothetical protein EYF80_012097 [Liparis tanakae]|uniref:Uncharacterized protein n=1 Tax=Liparis tanakae TaxID=230148 RepID=A0A4Z2IIG6_9TELE|nr:hypothetical protein EYF80_012097 [Liparis tanakae]